MDPDDLDEVVDSCDRCGVDIWASDDEGESLCPACSWDLALANGEEQEDA